MYILWLLLIAVPKKSNISSGLVRFEDKNGFLAYYNSSVAVAVVI
jgi:hypothetical protein